MKRTSKKVLKTANGTPSLCVYRTDADKEAVIMTPKECERIYNEAYRAVYWTAMSLLKNEADAEDVVQDTFVTLLESH